VVVGKRGRREPFATESFARGDAHGGMEREAVAASPERSGSRGTAGGLGFAETQEGLSSLGTEGLTAGDRAGIAGGEKRLYFERSIGCGVNFVGREEPELTEVPSRARKLSERGGR
jgi:hypothetical protein